MKDLYRLTRPFLSFTATLSGLAGFFAGPSLHPLRAIGLFFGLFLLACGASCLNQVQEWRDDQRMSRTRKRPIPQGRLTPKRGALIAFALFLGGSVSLSFSLPCLFLGWLALGLYHLVYTPLKRLSPFAAIPGGLIGALPPGIGYVAGGGSLKDPIAVGLMVFFFLWQVPHFWALLLRYEKDYHKAGFPTACSILGQKGVQRLLTHWLHAAILLSLLFPFWMKGNFYVALGGFSVGGMAMIFLTFQWLKGKVKVSLLFKGINGYALWIIGMLILAKGGFAMALGIDHYAPDFALPDGEQKVHRLSDFKGSWVVLYFYPKDNTPGCTIEARAFTALQDTFKKEGAVVIGVSPDSPKSHCNFRDKHDLKILLLSDEEKKVANLYGVWQKKKMAGREYYGIIRSTFLINPEGKIAHIWHKVKAQGHAEEVLKTLRKLK